MGVVSHGVGEHGVVVSRDTGKARHALKFIRSGRGNKSDPFEIILSVRFWSWFWTTFEEVVFGKETSDDEDDDVEAI